MIKVNHTCSPSVKHACLPFAHSSGMDTIGARIGKAMELRGENPASVGRAVGKSRQAIAQVVDGSTKEPHPSNLLLIADFLRVEIRWLISGEGPMTKEEASLEKLDLNEVPEDKRPILRATHDAFKKRELGRVANGSSHPNDHS